MCAQPKVRRKKRRAIQSSPTVAPVRTHVDSANGKSSASAQHFGQSRELPRLRPLPHLPPGLTRRSLDAWRVRRGPGRSTQPCLGAYDCMRAKNATGDPTFAGELGHESEGAFSTAFKRENASGYFNLQSCSTSRCGGSGASSG